MLPNDIVRAWKDEAYRSSLSEDERSYLPQHPAGLIELSDAELVDANGQVDPTLGPICTSISLSTAISALISCWESIAHGSCGAWSIGCCDGGRPPV